MLYEDEKDASYATKTQQDCKAAEMLLSPIGLRCTWNLFECAVLRDGKLATAITDYDTAFSAVFSYPEFLIYMMMRHIVNFAFNDNEHSLIRNPYFGCNTLEEALVKSDLIGEQL